MVPYLKGQRAGLIIHDISVRIRAEPPSEVRFAYAMWRYDSVGQGLVSCLTLRLRRCLCAEASKIILATRSEGTAKVFKSDEMLHRRWVFLKVHP